MAGIAKVCQAATPKSLQQMANLRRWHYFLFLWLFVCVSRPRQWMVQWCSNLHFKNGDFQPWFYDCFPMLATIFFANKTGELFRLGLLAPPFGAIFASADRWVKRVAWLELLVVLALQGRARFATTAFTVRQGSSLKNVGLHCFDIYEKMILHKYSFFRNILILDLDFGCWFWTKSFPLLVTLAYQS